MTAHTLIRRFSALAALLALTLAAPAQAPATKSFNVPADLATKAIQAFSGQSGVEVLVPTEAVKGVRTHAVKGEMTPRAALEKMMAGTGLTVIQDEKTGALGLRADPAAAKNAESRAADADAVATPKTLTSAIKLETYTVLGTRIRQTENEGPSPVSTYNSEYIRGSGAFTLADFLNQIPQVYNGISSGRGSTPNELNPEFGQRSESSSPAFNFVLGSAAAPAAQTGVSGVSLRGLGAGSTLVLVDGRRGPRSGAGNRSSDTRQGFFDLNTIPLGMVERIEVITDGASAIYGADAVAGVINIILKKNWSGTELSGSVRVAEHGGGRERNASITHGFSFGKLSGSVTLDYFDRSSLKASQRSFSAEQNHTAIPAGTLLSTGAVQNGRDYRLLWGYPAVFQASGGTVPGTFNAIPGVRVVLLPDGTVAMPGLSAFIPTNTVVPPASVVNASGQRRTSTTEFLDLIPESKRSGAAANFTYRFNDRLDAFAGFRTSESRTETTAQLSANSITGGFGTPAVLLAAFNPFNQNVQVGMVLPEFGPEYQKVKTLSDSVNGGVRGRVGETWQFELSGSWDHQKNRQLTRLWNGAGFSNLLNHADPAQRFNPFIDYRASGAPSQAALLEQLAVYPNIRSEVEQTGFDFNADGDVVEFWGGPIKLAWGGSTSKAEVETRNVTYSLIAAPVATILDQSASQTTNALYAEVAVPLVGKANAKPFASRFELQAAGRYEEVGPFSKSVPKLGFAWSPVQSVLLRASWSESFRAPWVTEYMVQQTPLTSTLTDPRRTPTSTTGVSVTRGSNPASQPELSESTFVGLVYEPKFAKGLSLQVNFYETEQTNTLQLLSAQNIVNNEALFPGRVTRAAPDATDISLNQPGRITAVEAQFINFGRILNRSADILVDYTLPWETYGHWRMNVGASRTLDSIRQLAPNQPPVVLEEDTSSPPPWKLNAAVFWRKGNWNASAFLWYLGEFQSNNSGNTLVADSTAIKYYPTPAVTKLDLRASYEFTNGVWRGYGKGLRLGAGVNNVFDKEPPFSDTVWGYNAALHSQLTLGRAYELSFVLPF